MDGFRVVRIMRVAVDEQVYETAYDAQLAMSQMSKFDPENSYAICHTSYPLDTL